MITGQEKRKVLPDTKTSTHVAFDIADPSNAGRVSHIKLINGPAHQESLLAQWLECPTSIWEDMGSIPVGDSDFFFDSRSLCTYKKYS